MARRSVALVSLSLLGLGCVDEGSDPLTDAGVDMRDGSVDGGRDASTGPDSSTAVTCPDPEAPLEWPIGKQDLTVTPHASWSATLDVDSPFLTSRSVDGFPLPLRWAKWTILLEDPETVYFQNTREYPQHHDFIAEHVDPFLGIDASELDAISLNEPGAEQRIVRGAVIFPTRRAAGAYGIRILGRQPYPPALVEDLFGRVAAAVDAPGLTPTYVPAGNQVVCTEAASARYEAAGIPIGTTERWLDADECYAPGWAVGRLVSLEPSQIDASLVDGTLTPDDILLVEGRAPAKLPPVAGILSLTPSPRSSGAPMTAEAHGIPFAFLRRTETIEAAQNAVGKIVGFGAGTNGFTLGCSVDVVDLSAVPAANLDELRAMSAPRPRPAPEIETAGAIALEVDAVGLDDIGKVGGRAAYYGMLRDRIPGSVRPAVVLTFDAWSRYLDQEIDGASLREAIDRRLQGLRWPPDPAELDAALSEIRTLILARSDFDATLRSEIEAGLSSFEATAPLRFEISTNAQDGQASSTDRLQGPWLGCLADDLDRDEAGPSACNAEDPEERGIYDALRRIYAESFERGPYLTRLRRGLGANDVAVAVLVRPAGSAEQATGRARFVRRSGSDRIDVLSQVKGVSLYDGSGDTEPELVRVNRFGFGTYPELVRESNLLSLGATVLPWEKAYVDLTDLMARVADPFGETATFALELDYRKAAGADPEITGALPHPVLDRTRDVVPLLQGENRLCVLQGESSDVFAIHRLKSRWNTQNRVTWLDADGVTTPIIERVDVTIIDDGDLAQLEGAIATLPGFSHEVDGTEIRTGFAIGAGRPRTVTLTQALPEDRSRYELPVVDLDALFVQLVAEYESPVPFIDWNGSVQMRSSESARLISHCPGDYAPNADDQRQERTMTSGGVTVTTAFFFPPAPTGPTAGYTAPLVAWEGTTITGLTSRPIELSSAWAQTYRPEHHNFGGNYLYQPALDPGVDAATLSELEAAGVELIYANERDEIYLVGSDGSVRSPM